MKSKVTTAMLVLVFFLGLSLILYPTVSNLWNNRNMAKVIANYDSAVENLEKEDYTKLWEEAEKYNEELSKRSMSFDLSDESKIAYEKVLNVAEEGVMGTIEIPSIRCYLPIYHDTEENVLQVACGHIPGSSLPVGGESSHSVLSGHRGLPSATLFTDLDKLVEGDIFMIHVLGKTLTYQVDQIRIVLPEEVSELSIEKGKDQCTLVTCTPYGINTHRLLVRGHRIESRLDLNVPMDATQIDPKMAAPIMAVPLILIFVLSLRLKTRLRR